MNSPPVCPACGAALKKMPQRKTKCPACGSFMFVKYSPTDRDKRLVTEAEAERIEAEWNAHHAEQARLRQADGLQREFDIAPGAYAALRAQMAASFGEEHADWNVEYFLLRQQFAASAKGQRAYTAFRLARLAEQRGLDFMPYLRIHFHEKLLDWQQAPAGFVVAVEIVRPGNGNFDTACPACHADTGRQLTLAEAASRLILPHRACACGESGFCRCEYRPIFKGEPTA